MTETQATEVISLLRWIAFMLAAGMIIYFIGKAIEAVKDL